MRSVYGRDQANMHKQRTKTAVDAHALPVQKTWLMLALTDSLHSVSSYAIASRVLACTDQRAAAHLTGAAGWHLDPASFLCGLVFGVILVLGIELWVTIRLFLVRWTDSWGSEPRLVRPRALGKPLCKIC